MIELIEQWQFFLGITVAMGTYYAGYLSGYFAGRRSK